METNDPRERIDQLLKQHEMTLSYDEIFDRYFIKVYDKKGEAIWECKGIATNLEALRNSLLVFLEKYRGE